MLIRSANHYTSSTGSCHISYYDLTEDIAYFLNSPSEIVDISTSCSVLRKFTC
jgi:hypothetical protein